MRGELGVVPGETRLMAGLADTGHFDLALGRWGHQPDIERGDVISTWFGKGMTWILLKLKCDCSGKRGSEWESRETRLEAAALIQARDDEVGAGRSGLDQVSIIYLFTISI